MKKALFWDFDGTLSWPNNSFSTALETALQRNGYTIPGEKAVRFLETAYSWKNPQEIYPGKTGCQWWDGLFGKIRSFCAENYVDPKDMDSICSSFREILTDVSNYCLYPDTAETLQEFLNRGYRNYLVTNNYPEITENLKKLGIAHFFDGLVVSSHIGFEKPREEFFEYAKSLAGYPQVCCMIGDNPKADILGGKGAGWLTVAVHECRESAADHYFENLWDILTVLP